MKQIGAWVPRPMKRLGRIFKVGLLAIVVLGLVVSFTANLTPLQGPFERSISQAVGIPVTINGRIGLRPASVSSIWVRAEQIVVGEETAAPHTSARIARVDAEIDLLPLFNRIVSVNDLRLIGLNLTYLFEEDGLVQSVANWEAPEATSSDSFDFRQVPLVSVEDSHLRLGLDVNSAKVAIPLERAYAKPAEIGLAIGVDGHMNGRPLSFRGRMGPPRAFFAGYRIFLEGSFQSGTADLSLTGSIGDLAKHGFSFDVEGEAAKLGDVTGLLGITDLKQKAKASVAAKIEGDNRRIAFSDIVGGFGKGDFAGHLAIESDEGFTVMGEMHSSLLDLDAFEGAKFEKPRGRLFSDAQFPLEFLRTSKAEFRYTADTVLLANAALSEGDVLVIMSDGILSVNPIAVNYEQGSFDISFVINAREMPEMTFQAYVTDFDIGQLLGDLQVGEAFSVKLDFGAKLKGQGESLADMASAAQGQINLVLGEGQLSPDAARGILGDLTRNLPLLSVSLDRSATLLPGEDGLTDTVDLKCAVARLDVQGGMAHSSAFIIETSNRKSVV